MSKEKMTETQITSYALGLDVAQSYSRLPVEIDLDSLLQGITDIFKQNPPAISREEFETALTNLQEKIKSISEEAQKKAQEAGEKNKKEGEEYLAKNKLRKEVTETESGLQYEVIKEGSGKKPSATDTVSVHYVGTLLDGTEFDSSVARGEPATFPLNRVIPGWTEALQLMTPGSKYKLHIPAKLAYGSQGAGPKIGPESTLIFDVELLEVL